MEIRTEKKLIEKVVTLYVAEDGKEFETEKACQQYEFDLETGNAMEKVKEFQFIEDDYIPCDGQENMESHIYEWYKVENLEQLKHLQSLYGGVEDLKQFPEYVCVERWDQDDFEAFTHTLTGCKEYVKRFFEKFGYDVEFKAR